MPTRSSPSSSSVASQRRQVTLTPALPPVALNVPPLLCTGRLSSLFRQPACSRTAITWARRGEIMF
jgi:hypothetical protein